MTDNPRDWFTPTREQLQMSMIKDAGGAMVDLDAERPRVDELLGAFDDAVKDRLPIHCGTVFNAAINLLLKVIAASDDPSRMARLAAETVTQHFDGDADQAAEMQRVYIGAPSHGGN